MVKDKDEKEIVIDPEIVENVDMEKLEEIKNDIDNDKSNVTLKFYEKLRNKLADKFPKNGLMNKLTDYLFLLPDFFMLLCRLIVDGRVDNKTKGFILGVIAYVIMPIDIIPDFIPVIGYLDDLIIVVYALDQILKYTDEQILIENWSGKSDIIMSIKKILSLVDTAIGQNILMKIKGVFFKLLKGKTV